MKSRSALLAFLASTGSSLLAVSSAHAATYYWETNGNLAGFGSAAGTWSSGNTNLWSTNSAGTAATVNITTSNLDDINFGTAANAYSGTVTLSGNTTARSATFSGSSNVVLKSNGTARTLTLGSGGLTMNGTSTVTLGDGVAGNNLLIGLGTTGQTWTNNTANNLTILNTAATFTRSAGGTIAFNKASTGEFSMSTTVLPNDASGIIGSWAFFGIGTNTRYAYNNGNATSGTIAAYSTGSAAADAEAFTSSAANYDFSTTGTTTLTASRTANTIRYDGTGNEIDLGASGANTLTTNGILAVGASGTLTIKRTGGTGTLVAGSTGTNSELVIAGPQAISISAPISNGLGNSALTYSGTGTLTLSGDNTYSGATTVNSGTLVVGSATALGATGKALNVNGTGTLNLNGFDYTVGAFNGDNGTVTNSGASVKAFTVGSGNTSGAFGGAITGALSLTKIGSGSLAISNANTYTGGTFINAGSITGVQANSLGAGLITFTGSATIAPAYGTTTLANDVTVTTGTASFSLGSAAYDMNFDGVISGGGTFKVTNGNGSVAFRNSANTFTGAVIVESGADLSVSSLADSANSIQLGGTTLAGTFAYTGSTALSRGLVMGGTTGAATVTASGSGALTFSSFAATGSGAKTLTLRGTSSVANNIAGNIVNNGGNTSVTKADAGTWILSGANTYTGATTLSGGTLSVGASNNLGASGANLVFDGGTLRVTGTALSNISGIGHTVVFNATKAVGLDIENAAHTFTVDQALNQTIGGVTKLGLGKVVLNQTNTYTGATTLNAGTLKLDYSTGNTARFAGALALNGGNLELSAGSSYTQAATSTTLNNGTTFIKQTDSGANKLALGGITFTGGAIDFSAPSIATTTTGVTNGILSQRATVAGANFAMKSGSDIVAYDYATSGVTGYTGGAMATNTNYALQTAGAANTLGSSTSATSNTLKIANTATGSLAVGANTLTLGAILFSGSADYDITTSGAGKVTPSILHNYGTSGAVLNLGALGGALTQFGTGKTILTDAAQANAGVTVNGGTVQFSTNAQIGTPSNGAGITLNNGTLLASETLDLNNAGSNHRTITLGAGGGTLAAASTKNLTVSGVISGAGNSLSIGSASNTGTVSLAAPNTYTGPTTVNGGTLSVSGSIGSSAVTVSNAGTVLASGATGTIGNTVVINNGAILAAGGHAAAGTATALGAASFNDGSIFSWDINATGTGYDKLVAPSLAGEVSAGDAVFRIVASDATFADTFWDSTQTWGNIFTTNGTAAITGWASIFGNTVKVVNSSFGNITPVGGSFAISGSTLTWTAVPEPTSALAGLLLTAGLLRRRRTA